jgi:hypothetical protein
MSIVLSSPHSFTWTESIARRILTHLRIGILLHQALQNRIGALPSPFFYQILKGTLVTLQLQFRREISR